MDLKTLLLSHCQAYPLMEPQDAVKLLYQNEFGGGHLIQDPEGCLAFLRREYDVTPQSQTCPLSEDIGNGMLRVHLAALEHHGLSLADLGACFLRSAAAMQGSLESFQEKLTLLEDMTSAGQMPFSREMLQCYLADYRRDGFPMVSHSETYRNAYHPAYRVVSAAIFAEYKM